MGSYLLKYCTKGFIIFSIFCTLLFSQNKIACIGNSITMGALLANPSTESYPSQLQQLLGGDYIVYNYGIGNRVLLNGFPYSYTNSTQFTLSILQNYDFIIICLGTNDTQPEYHSAIDNFINDYQNLIKQYDNFPNEDAPYCIICLPPPIFANYDGHSNDYLTDEIIPRIKSVAYQTNSKIANFYAALIDYPEHFIDGIHPTVEGAGIMAQITKQKIDNILSPAPETPSNFTAVGGDNQVELSWDVIIEPDLLKYNIYRGVIDGGWKDLLISPDKSVTSYVDNGVDIYTTYYYQISSQNTANVSSDRSPQVSATPGGILDTTAPSTPTNFCAVSNNGYIHLNWSPNSEDDLSNYNLYRGTIDNGWKNYLISVDKNNNSFLDTNIDPNTTYFYQIDAQDAAKNTSQRSNQISATTLTTNDESILTNFTLSQNYPNPFNPNTKIKYQIPRDCQVAITIFDIEGNKVKSLLDKFEYTGSHFINWDGTDDFGSSVSAGTYLYQIVTGQYLQTRKMLLLK